MWKITLVTRYILDSAGKKIYRRFRGIWEKYADIPNHILEPTGLAAVRRGDDSSTVPRNVYKIGPAHNSTISNTSITVTSDVAANSQQGLAIDYFGNFYLLTRTKFYIHSDDSWNSGIALPSDMDGDPKGT